MLKSKYLHSCDLYQHQNRLAQYKHTKALIHNQFFQKTYLIFNSVSLLEEVC